MYDLKKVPFKWQQTYFSGLALDYLKAKSGQKDLFIPESERVLKHLKLSKSARILDVLCGFGFHAHCLAEKGYAVTGVDSAPECINNAKDLCRNLSTPTNFIQRTFETVTLPENTFDGAYCLGNSHGYLNKVDTLKFFRNIRKTLKIGTRFILHTSMIDECLDENLCDQVWEEYNGIFMLQNNEYDEDNKVLHTECVFLDINRSIREKSTIYHHIMSLDSLLKLLDMSGLEVIKLLNHDNNDTFSVGDAAVYIICEAV